ncbi:MAG TPA: DUF2007 domain-containing protein [Bacteroidales bacterium]|jgi:hypothetical protein|nr:DUF2007 domain-containing protein [Bacteroidales bacterium]MDD4234454.1 DUF2007 domain-containing protein [Bacteroidales bacterium]MDY0160174.1 DUF2007 domain-containing protein [Bacteroidales bacterium]HRW21854.1 DUF2007 domain-containing protein [Bacteroidales bacterium]HXK80617.1 DUF2007 domain-containing protein [Bacteroidales bacterium]
MADKLISLVKYRLEHRAFILKDYLNQNGIECWISDPTVFGQIDGSVVMVKSSDYEKAYQLYKELDNSSEEA